MMPPRPSWSARPITGFIVLILAISSVAFVVWLVMFVGRYPDTHPQDGLVILFGAFLVYFTTRLGRQFVTSCDDDAGDT